MTKDNVRLALIVCGIWGSLIIVAVGAEAIIHDGAIANVIVDTFSKVLIALVAAAAGVVSVSTYVNGKVATDPVAASVAAVSSGAAVAVSSPTVTVSPAPTVAAGAANAAPASLVVEPSSDAAGLAGAVSGPGVD